MAIDDYPEPQEYITAVQKRLGRVLFKDGRRFHVPLNQRPWSWTDTQGQDLLNDFYKVLTEYFDPQSSPKWQRKLLIKRPPHFFGTFVFYKKSEDNLEVFDGQQRITAVCMLCAVLRELANTVKAKSGPHQKQANSLFGAFNGWLAVKPTSTDPRLVPNKFFIEMFNALLFEPVDEADRAAQFEKLSPELRAHKVTKSVKRAFDHIRSWVYDEVDGLNAKETTNFLDASYDVLSSLFACIETIIAEGEETYAYEVFGCLNARGVSLTAADKIKNALFLASPKSQHANISLKWQKIGENAPDQNIGEYLRRRHISAIGPCKKNDIYGQITELEINTGKKVVDIVTEWHSDSEIVRQITQRDTVFNMETRDRLEAIFGILDIGLASIPLLAAHKRFFSSQKKDFLQCVYAIEKFVFRRRTIEQIDTTELERKLGDAARLLAGGASVKKLQYFLAGESPDDSFEREFRQHVERRAKVQYYILKELEIFLLGGGAGLVPGDHHSAKNHIEHVLPRNLSKAAGRTHEWDWARKNPARHKALINRLGNIIILEHDVNKQVGNHEYAVKRHGKFKKKNGKIKQYKCYKDSALDWPQRLSTGRAWASWTEVIIDKRQKQMAADALTVWQI